MTNARIRARAPRRAVALAPLAACLVAFAAAGDLEPGDIAPPFALPGSDGETYRLEDLLGERGVVLAWFPRAFTPG